jgi:uncharacterized protein (TIGR02001 family)|tara:strand:- start:43398 stop:44150 length:753 start_codon:yes stop_codon:yes gene_type:complete
MNKSINLIGVAAFAAVSSISAQEVSVSSAFGWESACVERGQQHADESFQPSIEFAVDDFYAGIWGSFGLNDNTSAATTLIGDDRVEYYAGYGFAISDSISGDVGVIYYTYSSAESFDNDNTVEIYAGATFDVVAAPSIYVYYDFDLENVVFEGSVGHSLEISEGVALDLGAAVGYKIIGEAVNNLGPAGNEDDYVYYSAYADLSYAVNENASVSVGARYGKNSVDNQFGDLDDAPEDDAFWYGFSGSVSF